MLQPFYTPDLVEAGLDEVGRGSLAGPVVAAAVILPKDFLHPLLNDSKQLTAKKREQLCAVIKQDAIAWAVAEVSQTLIDQINIANASFLAMHHALDQLTIRPELLLVDGNRFVPYGFVPHQCIVKGDSKFASIAAASVLAKTYRDALMCQLAKAYPMYQWHKNAAYPTKAHRAALAEYGPCEHHRRSFKLLADVEG